MMQNKTQGQQFLAILGVAKDDKDKMFTLLRSTLEKVNPFPSEKVNFSNIISQITDMDSIAAMKATQAGYKALVGNGMFAEDYVYLTAKAYKDYGMGNIKDFKHDFKQFTKDNQELTKDNPEKGKANLPKVTPTLPVTRSQGLAI